MEAPVEANGTWYRKPMLSDCDKPARKLKKEKKLIRSSHKEVELRDSLFRHTCVCNLCKRFDKPKCLKGGAKPKAIGMEGMFDAVVKVAENHGIKVKPDKPNAALGDCLFDSIVDNINHRPDDFPEKLLDGVDSYRELWVTELEEQYKTTAAFPGYHGKDMTDEELGEWTAAWTQQKNPCEYNVNSYNVSDLTPQGLGHCINRNILVFSTDPNEPVQIFKANFFDNDIVPITEVPVVIAYDHRRLHYESILPRTKTEVKKCTTLANALLTGTYDKSNPSDYLDKARKAKQAEAKRNKRAGESPVAKKARIEKVKNAMEDLRSNESVAEKQARTEQDKTAKADKRSTSETREAQNKRKADRKRNLLFLLLVKRASGL